MQAARCDTSPIRTPGLRPTSLSPARKHRAPPALVALAAQNRHDGAAADPAEPIPTPLEGVAELPRASLERLLEMLSMSLPSLVVPAAAVAAAAGWARGGGAFGGVGGAVAPGLLATMGALIDPRVLLRVCDALEATWQAAVWTICPKDVPHEDPHTRMRSIGTWRLIDTEGQLLAGWSVDGRERRNRGRRDIDKAVAAVLGRGERGMVEASGDGLSVPIYALEVSARACSTGQVRPQMAECEALVPACQCSLVSRSRRTRTRDPPRVKRSVCVGRPVRFCFGRPIMYCFARPILKGCLRLLVVR